MSARQGVGRLRTWVRAGYNEHDSEVGAQDEGDWASSWSGLTNVRSIGRGGERLWWEEQGGDSDARTGQLGW